MQTFKFLLLGNLLTDVPCRLLVSAIYQVLGAQAVHHVSGLHLIGD